MAWYTETTSCAVLCQPRRNRKVTLSSINDDQAMGILAFGNAGRGESQHTMVVSTLGALGVDGYLMKNGFKALNSNRIHDTRSTHLLATDTCRYYMHMIDASPALLGFARRVV